jgi:hypothetical protein
LIVDAVKGKLVEAKECQTEVFVLRRRRQSLAIQIGKGLVIEATCRHITKIQCGGAQPAHTLREFAKFDKVGKIIIILNR